MKTLKRTLCLVLAVVMALSLFAVAASAKKLSDYDDAAAVSSDYQVAVDVATQLGILEGMGADTYGAKGTLTRAQLATMLYRMVTGDVAKKYVANYAGGAAFSDVKEGAWYAGYVNYAADKGLLAGVGGNKYAPSSTLTGYQTLAAFLRALGYGTQGEFLGNTWKDGVVKYASAIDGDIVADWSKPISREVAAQLIYNTLKATRVRWSEFTKDYVAVNANFTLAESVFGVARATTGTQALVIETNFVDDYGTLGEIWYKNVAKASTDIIVAAPYPVVKSYNVAVTGCTVLKDLGIPETNLTSAPTYTKWTYDGESSADTLTHRANDCAVTFGNQGVMTTIYKKATNNYVIAEVETYLAKISKNTAAAAHVEADVEAGIFTVGGVDTEDVLNGTAYAVNTYVLVIRGQGTWTVIGAAPSTVAAYKTLYTPAVGLPTWTVGTGNYKAANNWVYNSTVKAGLTLNTNYTWYFDQFGNIIGVDTYTAPKSYAVVDAIQWQDGTLAAGKAVANLVYMDGTTASAVELKKAGTNDLANDDANTACTYASAKLNDTLEYNTEYRTHLYEVSGTTITKTGIELNGCNLTIGNPAIGSTYSGSASTVYLLRYKDAAGAVAYKTFTGFAAMPSVVNADIDIVVGDDSFAEYVFVDATVPTAVVTDTVATTITAYVTDIVRESLTTATDANSVVHNVREYTVYVDGAPVTVKTIDKDINEVPGATVAANNLWTLTADSTGYLVKAAAVTEAGKKLDTVTSVDSIAADKSSAFVTIGGTSKTYSVVGTPVYVYNSTTGMAVKSFADTIDFAGATGIQAIVSVDGASLVAVYVY